MGHDFEEAYRKWRSCPPEKLFFEARVVQHIPEDMKPIAEQLKKLSERCTKLVLWLDCDTEGEAICFEVAGVCHEARPSLRYQSRTLRATFSAASEQQVRRASRQ